MRYHSHTLSTISTVALLSATQAFGQAADPFHLGTILIGSDASASATNTGGNTAASTNQIGLSNQDLTRTNPTDLQDVFKSQPTIAVGSSLPVSQKIYVNGVEENNLNVTIDGARQNNRIFHHSATTYIDPELLKAVRVDPGVAPADAGPGAMAGAIAFETKDAADLLRDGRDFGARTTLGFADNGKTTTGSLALYGRTGRVDYLVFGKKSDGSTIQDGSGANINGSGASLQSGLAKIGITTDNGSRIELSYENVTDDAQRPNRADFAALTRRGVLNAGTRRYRLDRKNAVLTYTGARISPMWKPTFQLAYNSTDLFTGAFTGRTDDYSGTSKSITGKFENEFELQNGTVTAGLDFYNDTVDINGEGSVAYFAKEKSRNVGAYVQGRFEFNDRIKVSTGLRYDFQTFEGVDGTSYKNSGLSANIAGDFQLSDGLTISAGASQGWGGIALAESYLFDTAWTYPNAITPVTSRNIYLGATGQLGAFSLSAKVFQSDVNNVRTLYDQTTKGFGKNPGATSSFATKGYELGVGYNWGDGFARLAYANVDTKVNGQEADSYSGRYQTVALGEKLTIEAAHTFQQIDLTLGADVQMTFDKKASNQVAATGPIKGYRVVNVFAEYKPRQFDNLTIRAEVKNLTNETYTERASYGQEFNSVTPLNEPGRTIGIFATLEF